MSSKVNVKRTKLVKAKVKAKVKSAKSVAKSVKNRLYKHESETVIIDVPKPG